MTRRRHLEGTREDDRLAAKLGARLFERRHREKDGTPVESFKSPEGDRSYRLSSK
jgi:hypothetical protein